MRSAARLFTLEPDTLDQLINEDFDNLVVLAIAEATHTRPPQHIKRMLRRAVMREDWRDALLCAAGELQVATERMTYLDDERLPRTRDQLRAVRQRSHEAAKLIGRQHRGELRQRSTAVVERTRHPVDLAQRWLTHIYRDEFHAAVRDLREQRNLDAVPRNAQSRTGMFEQAIDEGWIDAPISDTVAALRSAPDQRFRLIVANDAKDQNEREPALRHPVLLDRWLDMLNALTADTIGPAHASSPHSLGDLAIDLRELDNQAAYSILNARRFYCALAQRRVECKRWLRVWMAVTEEQRDADPRVVAQHEVLRDARRIVADRHAAEFERLMALLLDADGRPVIYGSMSHTDFEVAKARILREAFPEG